MIQVVVVVVYALSEILKEINGGYARKCKLLTNTLHISKI